MRDFKYFRPRTLKEALSILTQERAKVLAGGTDLLVKMKDGLLRPESVMDISFLEELKFIREEEGMVTIGALATHSMLERSPIINTKAPHLAEASRSIGSPQIRNVATIGGNIVNASPAGDSLPPLYTLEAELLLESEKGSRIVAIEEFFTGPGQSIIEPHELLTAIRFKAPRGELLTFFQKLGQRKALAISKVSVAFLATCAADKKFLRKVRIALGAVAPTVIRAREVESFLENGSINEEMVDLAAKLCSEEARPISDIRSTLVYRKKVTGELLKRGLSQFIEGVIS
ncbi:MAG: xanthine dehydrogenase family protein subunit M [Caldiserica bacterium]|nr:xanthine dehydrogenase family protein subunit M [Caldisericota bacterium]